MRLREIVQEDFCNYKKPSMFLVSCFCNFKCCTELNIDKSVCQNEPLVQGEIKDISNEYILNTFKNNPITKAIVIGGLEPFQQFDELLELIKLFRDNEVEEEFVIYTGYYKDEIKKQIDILKQFKNIIIKFGRFIPDDPIHYDETLGVMLVSSNQYGEKIS